MTRQVNADTIKLITSFEKFEPAAYRDEAGILTIGWGHVGPDVYWGLTITPAQGQVLLDKDLERAENYVTAFCAVPLNDWQYGALCSFTFNVGGNAFRTSTMLKLLNNGWYSQVPVSLLQWKYVTIDGKKVISDGLLRRRMAEAALWRTPVEQPATV